MKPQLEAILNVEVFYSETDIAAGEEFWKELRAAMKAVDAALFLVDKTFFDSNWALFELGYLYCRRDSDHSGGFPLCILLFGLSPSDCKGPITFLQAKQWSADGLADVIITLVKNQGRPSFGNSEVQILRKKALLLHKDQDTAIQRIMRTSAVLTTAVGGHQQFIAYLKRIVSDKYHSSLDILAHNSSYHAEVEYVDSIFGHISELQEGDTFCAVCGSKNLRLQKWTEYMELNVAVARKGAFVRRLYIEPDAGFSQEEIGLISRHFNDMQAVPGHKFCIAVLTKDQAAHYRNMCGLRQEYGIGIVGRRPKLDIKRIPEDKHAPNIPRREYAVFLHYDFSNPKEVGARFDNRFVANAARTLFNEMWDRTLSISDIKKFLATRNPQSIRPAANRKRVGR